MCDRPQFHRATARWLSATTCCIGRGVQTALFRTAMRLAPRIYDMQAGGGVMPTPWKVSGQYYETCNCDFICPCLPGQMAVRPSKGSCTFVMAFQVERGNYGSLSL